MKHVLKQLETRFSQFDEIYTYLVFALSPSFVKTNATTPLLETAWVNFQTLGNMNELTRWRILNNLKSTLLTCPPYVFSFVWTRLSSRWLAVDDLPADWLPEHFSAGYYCLLFARQQSSDRLESEGNGWQVELPEMMAIVKTASQWSVNEETNFGLSTGSDILWLLWTNLAQLHQTVPENFVANVVVPKIPPNDQKRKCTQFPGST